MSPVSYPPLSASELDILRAELADLAFELERRGRHEAAELANAVAARLAGFVAAGEGLPDAPGAA